MRIIKAVLAQRVESAPVVLCTTSLRGDEGSPAETGGAYTPWHVAIAQRLSSGILPKAIA